MKRFKSFYVLAAFATLFALGPTAGWCTRVIGDRVSGEITATPISGSIEVDHRRYRIKPESAAAKDLHGFAEGQKVDLTLDGPPENKDSEVMLITVHDTP